jgi:hypothetical protein
MNSYPNKGRPRNPLCQPDLFDCSGEEDLRGANPAARRLAARFGISIHHAMVLMQIHGIGTR